MKYVFKDSKGVVYIIDDNKHKRFSKTLYRDLATKLPTVKLSGLMHDRPIIDSYGAIDQSDLVSNVSDGYVYNRIGIGYKLSNAVSISI